MIFKTTQSSFSPWKYFEFRWQESYVPRDPLNENFNQAEFNCKPLTRLHDGGRVETEHRFNSATQPVLKVEDMVWAFRKSLSHRVRPFIWEKSELFERGPFYMPCRIWHIDRNKEWDIWHKNNSSLIQLARLYVENKRILPFFFSEIKVCSSHEVLSTKWDYSHMGKKYLWRIVSDTKTI